MIRDASISLDGLYRYWLWRQWDSPVPSVICWVMLNPSMADAEVDDPTIRRCISFSKAWGYGRLVVVNLFALRVTRPVHLNDHPDPIGPVNDEIAGVMIRNLPVIAAWGAHRKAAERLDWFAEQIAQSAHPVRCLGTTKDGHPKHPLYVRATTEPQAFVLPERVA